MIIEKTVTTQITDENGNDVQLPADLAAQVAEGKKYTYTPASIEEYVEGNE